jgi:large subunit ribosomal protein L3
MPLGLIGKKLGHTRVYNADGVLIPVTVVLAGPNRVLQVKTAESDGYSAVQLAFGDQKPQRLAKAELGHLVKFGALTADEVKNARKEGGKKPLTAVARIKEFRNFSKEVKTGDLIGPTIFEVGDFVDAIGTTKGRGFEGVVGRWAFRGGDSTHGAKGWHRRSGAIGCRLFPGHVRRGLKMPGHMGQVRRTTQNLEVVQIHEMDNLLLIKGSIPGSEGDYVIIREAKKMSREFTAKKKAEQASKTKTAGKGKGGAKAAEAAKK